MKQATAVPSPKQIATPTREPLLARSLAAGLWAILALVFVMRWPVLVSAARDSPLEIGFWVVLLFVLNLFPIKVGQLSLALDMPLLLATALLYHPVVATFIALVGSFDPREIRREVTWTRALFNRGQIGLTVMSAALIIRVLTEGNLIPWPRALLATAAASVASYGVNVALVSVFAAARLRIGPIDVLRQTRVGELWQFLGIYLGFRLLAVIIAFLYQDVGPWAVAAFLLPVLVARQLLVRNQQLSEATRELQEGEKALQELLDRTVDERRDERLRVAAELHDDVLQLLTRLRQLGGDLLRQAPGLQQGEEIIAVTDSSMEALRDVMRDLRGSPLGRAGLGPTLVKLTRDLQLEHGVKIISRLETLGQNKLPPKLQVIIYQVAREALLNALTHAHACQIALRIRNSSQDLTLEVVDDGCGFDPESADDRAHFGVGLMTERARSVGGTLSIESGKGHGTRVRATFPLAG